MPTTRGVIPEFNGGALSFKAIVNAASYLVQAALIGLMSMFFHWISTQNEVNTQTSISLSKVTSAIESSTEAYKELKARSEKVEDRMHQLELQLVSAGVHVPAPIPDRPK